ncbi:hypothetical protein FA95DRAFT_1562646 [Auriscalpium vulgare]|uniref:Uncharacterized protein n=1 Tax=Auriscalpium vulgare TaxID=40419 RepID=A0ACB8RJZ3_9AGAM|nr:hypothetical protein FA95DRAFT_1562646 [Auriscalpium vulgare]
MCTSSCIPDGCFRCNLGGQTERKKKKSGAAASHAKVAEKLLAAQLRREALNHTLVAQKSASSQGKEKGPVIIDENTVYLEDLDPNVPKTPKTPVSKGKEKEKAQDPGPSPFSASKNRWHDHDPYRLPDVDVEERVAKAAKSAADPRLATEEELRSFIEDMRPEDFDVSSPAFRELPTEVQYEIVGDLRLKSRQTSYQRLQNMLRNSRTPLDFSKEQIKNLQQRNSLTQQLLVTTDTIGQAHIAIPVRIASERNREYVLMKNTGADGGWVLGIRDHGTKSNPIQIDQDASETKDEDDDDDMEMEEVHIPRPLVADADLQEYQREMALAGIGKRQTSKNLTRLSTKPPKKKPKPPPPRPLFEPEDDELPTVPGAEDDDFELAAALQDSIDVEEEAMLRRAVEASRAAHAEQPSTEATSTADSMEVVEQTPASSDVEELYVPGRLETALAIANAGPAPKAFSSHQYSPRKSVSFEHAFGQPTLLPKSQKSPTTPLTASGKPPSPHLIPSPSGQQASSRKAPQRSPTTPIAGLPKAVPSSPEISPLGPAILLPSEPVHFAPEVIMDSDSDEDMEEVQIAAPVPPANPTTPKAASAFVRPLSPAKETPLPSANAPLILSDSEEEDDLYGLVSTQVASVGERSLTSSSLPVDISAVVSPSPELVVADTPLPSPLPPSLNSVNDVLSPTVNNPALPTPSARSVVPGPSLDEEPFSDWSRSPSPVADFLQTADPKEGSSSRPAENEETWDAAHEMDPLAEEGEFARFMSQVKGKDLDAVRREIDDEIKTLHQQKKVALRDSEDITQQMISQIMVMLRLFGIPYITAPMEAEAQCAALVELGLVEGIITDDSDVFLFGGLRVFKNMFNQSKTVECFLLADLGRELGLERDKLVQLAYLLGSDYVDGLPGVGPVVAMELLKEFPGSDGLHKFKAWWQRVQSGRDRPEDTNTKFKQRFKRKFKDLYLTDDWPPAVVRDAYYHPTVDESDEPFKWGLPDLDGLRSLFQQELGWSSSKVEELLLPIIQKMNKRGQANALNKQGNLNEYLNVTSGQGAYAPRKQKAYASKRLQQVVNDFRKEQAKLKQASGSDTPVPDASASSSSDDDSTAAPLAKGKGKGKAARKAAPKEKSASAGSRGKAKGIRGTARGRGRGRGAKSASGKRKRAATTSGSDEDDGSDNAYEGDVLNSRDEGKTPPPLSANLRRRPRARPAYKGKDAVIDQDREDSVGAE